MFLRKSFQEFLVLHSEPEPLPTLPPRLDEGEPPADLWLIDWRWLETSEDVP
jgi:hypothetical protein